MSGPRSGLTDGSRLSQYTFVPAATLNELGMNAFPWIVTNAETLISGNDWVNTLEPAAAWTLTVELTTVAPLAAVRVRVTGV
jgi:hypothetical protein